METVCAFSADGRTCAHAIPLPDTPLHTKVTFRKTIAIESQNTRFVVEQLEQILRGRVPCNVCGSDDLCYVLHCVLLCATKGRDRNRSMEWQRITSFFDTSFAGSNESMALNHHGFSEGHFRAHPSFHTCLIYFFAPMFQLKRAPIFN